MVNLLCNASHVICDVQNDAWLLILEVVAEGAFAANILTSLFHLFYVKRRCWLRPSDDIYTGEETTSLKRLYVE